MQPYSIFKVSLVAKFIIFNKPFQAGKGPIQDAWEHSWCGKFSFPEWISFRWITTNAELVGKYYEYKAIIIRIRSIIWWHNFISHKNALQGEFSCKRPSVFSLYFYIVVTCSRFKASAICYPCRRKFANRIEHLKVHVGKVKSSSHFLRLYATNQTWTN